MACLAAMRPRRGARIAVLAGAGGSPVRHRGGVRLDKRAAVVAAAAVAVGVGLGYWSGAVPGVLAALAGLIPAVIWQVAVNRQGTADERDARLAAAEAAFARRPAAVPVADGGGVARYLRPEAEVVRFWPRPELDDLLAWVISGQRVGVGLVTGAGGSGKTRLARELGEQVTGLGWRSWWVPAGQEADAARAAAEGGVPVLLISDYAEMRAASLPAMLAAAAAAGDGGPCLRVLLLARSVGEWWQQLQDACTDDAAGDLIADVRPVTLGPVADRAAQGAVFAEALEVFAALRGIPCPDAAPGLTDPDAVVLVVHAAALLAVLDAEADTGSSMPGGDPLGGVLRHSGGTGSRAWPAGCRAAWGPMSPTRR